MIVIMLISGSIDELRSFNYRNYEMCFDSDGFLGGRQVRSRAGAVHRSADERRNLAG
ncbi:hypothetical protein [Mucilaginibacter sp. AK015]|uniref:hypothetical protein n=1 Tax=Mucilaginibacter sp. AK015 TaxID=2723072 RepID=UPI002107894E|nr:hypothetical protein [Mucilaginibacter sp. AK015]